MLPDQKIYELLLRPVPSRRVRIAVFPKDNTCLSCGRSYSAGEVHLHTTFIIMKAHVGGELRRLFGICHKCHGNLSLTPRSMADFATRVFIQAKKVGFFNGGFEPKVGPARQKIILDQAELAEETELTTIRFLLETLRGLLDQGRFEEMLILTRKLLYHDRSNPYAWYYRGVAIANLSGVIGRVGHSS